MSLKIMNDKNIGEYLIFLPNNMRDLFLENGNKRKIGGEVDRRIYPSKLRGNDLMC